MAGTKAFDFLYSMGGRNLCEQKRNWDDRHRLRRGVVAFFRGSTQLHWTMWGQADRVDVRSRSKGDQLRDGMVMTRARADPPFTLWARGGAVK